MFYDFSEGVELSFVAKQPAQRSLFAAGDGQYFNIGVFKSFEWKIFGANSPS